MAGGRYPKIGWPSEAIQRISRDAGASVLVEWGPHDQSEAQCDAILGGEISISAILDAARDTRTLHDDWLVNECFCSLPSTRLKGPGRILNRRRS